MKFGLAKLISVAALIFLGSILAWGFAERAKQKRKEWPGVQVERCADLCNALRKYREQEGAYPESLQSLVAFGVLTSQEYEKLLFQPSAGSKPQEWKYRQLPASSEVLLLSQEPVIPWKGSSGSYIVGYTNRASWALGANKLSGFLRNLEREEGQELSQ